MCDLEEQNKDGETVARMAKHIEEFKKRPNNDVASRRKQFNVLVSGNIEKEGKNGSFDLKLRKAIRSKANAFWPMDVEYRSI